VASKKPLQVAMLAPIEPYRSGVAKHSTQVALELDKRDDISLTVYSFKRLYPALLFPGTDDKDSESSVPETLNCQFTLDTINPLSWFAVIKRLKSNNTNLVIIPAWTFFVAPCLGFITKQCQKYGIDVITIVHNAFDHEAGFIKNALMRYQLNKCKKFLVHNQSLANDIKQELPTAEVAICPHPIFDQYPSPTQKLEKRAELELLFFGIIRDYKGLDILLNAVAELQDIDFKLTIVGECWGSWDKYQKQIDDLQLNNRVEKVIQYASDEEAANYFTRADVVVLPYRSMTGTGVIPLAYHFETPVICSDLPAFHEVVKNHNTGVIAKGQSSKDIAQAITKFQELRTSVDFASNTRDLTQLFTWQKFCDELLQLKIETN
jgi:glycosyltransferase involved in cell wall biosynthesis